MSVAVSVETTCAQEGAQSRLGLTNRRTTEVLQDREPPTDVMHRPELGYGVPTGRDPDGQDAEDEDDVGGEDDGIEAADHEAALDDAGEGDCEGDLCPARGNGGHGYRGVMEAEEGAHGAVGVITDIDGAADEGGSDEEDQLVFGVNTLV